MEPAQLRCKDLIDQIVLNTWINKGLQGDSNVMHTR